MCCTGSIKIRVAINTIETFWNDEKMQPELYFMKVTKAERKPTQTHKSMINLFGSQFSFNSATFLERKGNNIRINTQKIILNGP